MSLLKKYAVFYAHNSGIREEKIPLSFRLRIISAVIGVIILFIAYYRGMDGGQSIVTGFVGMYFMEYILYSMFDCYRPDRLRKFYVLRWIACIFSCVFCISGIFTHFVFDTEEDLGVLLIEVMIAVMFTVSLRNAIRARR